MKLFVANAIATFFGAGLSPKMPGTIGTLAAVPLVFFLSPLSETARLIFWIGLLVVGTWAAVIKQESSGKPDDQSIVIDEVIGYGITAWFAGSDSIHLFIAFLLFRFFDILKLPPVRQVDIWSKSNPSRTMQAFGVIADDMLAGLQGLIVILILKHFGVF